MQNNPPTLQPQGNDKIWSMLCHLSGFIGVGFILPLVVYLAMRRESEYVAANSREALNFHISIFIYMLCCIPLMFVAVGIPLAILIGLGSLVFSVVAAVRSSDGRVYHYPLCLRLVR
jgi:uncharacterized protein